MGSKMMCNMLVSSIFVLLFSLSDSTPDSCYGIHYRTINDPRRSTGYVSSNDTKTHLCDRTLLKESNNVWYRFSSDAGGEMPTTKPKHGTCGTFVPIWMNGSHPTIEEGTVARKACANVPHFYPFGCAYSYNIHVRNCSGYYIYQLKTPKHCILAYCAGSKVFNCSADPGSCFANRPPYINMPDRCYAFEKSQFQLFINATDPEGYGIRDYDFLSNKTVSSVSIDEEIATISVTQSGKVSLRVTDREYAQSSLHTIHIVALPCSCMNEGKCKSNKSVSTVREDFSNFTCDCVKPYTGRLCEVTPCDNLPCFPGVNCSVMGDGYKCEECPVRFEGDGKNCQLNVSGDMVVVDAELKIISELKWNDDLLNETSLFYKDQTAKIVTQITQAYYSTKDFLNVVVVRYRNESVVVEFQVVLKKKINDPLGPLKTSAKQNNSGIFTVDANSVKEKENRPPYFSMPHRYYALEDSEFQLVLNATDPEGYPLRYSYLPNVTISSISVDPKRKLVKISVKESGRVSLIVTDFGGREDIHTIDFVTISCSCEKGGKCYHHTNVSTKREDFSNFKCDCVKPYTGRLCEDSPCDKIPCFPGVSCSVTSDHDGYECEKCPAGLKGDGEDCQIILTDDEVVIGEMKITSGLKWNADLLNKSSPHFKNETFKIVTEITKAYSGTKNFVVVVVIRYRKGSVVVEFQVVLKEKMNDPLKPLRTRNKFGKFQVDPHSVREENSTEVEGTLNVVSGLEWKDDLLNKSSSYFKTESFKIANEISKMFADEKDFVYVFVTGFRKNNLVVEFKLVWRNKPDDPLEKLRSATKNGKLGHMEIDTGSVKEKSKCYNHKMVSTKHEDFSNLKCDCPKPYTGRLCEVSPCHNLPCFPGVNCYVTGDGYRCENCPAGLKGDGEDCQIDLTDNTVVIEGEMKITLGLTWNDDLLNKTSLLYRNETAKIVAEITKAYSDTKNFLIVVVTRYRKGSVVVEFQVVLKEKMNDPLEPLRTRAMQNKFGKFQVDPQSVKEETQGVSSNDDSSYFGLDKAVFIVLVCLVSVLALICIVVCGICIRKKHISIIMLTTHDDHHGFCNRGEDSQFQMQKRPSHNQVVDIGCINKRP